MCGIFAYIGKRKNASEIVYQGLKKLEYRGYDSWGIAAKAEPTDPKFGIPSSKLVAEKHTGKISASKLSSRLSALNSCLAVGHTRWATHGKVSARNAHPHLNKSGTIAVVHNGIFENYESVKKKLSDLGYRFVSDTDSEVFAHLVDYYLRHHSFQDAFLKSFKEFKGLSAVVAIDLKSHSLSAAKTGSPLIVGRSVDGYYLASDATAILPNSQDLLFVNDNQMVNLDRKFTLYDLKSDGKISPAFQKVSWKEDNPNMGKYKHFLIKEINEQPQVIQNIIANLSDDIRKARKDIENAYGVFMLGCGSASYAALAGVYFFSIIANRHINFSIGSEFAYLENYLTRKSLIIPISQSGETIDVIHPIQKAKKRGARVIAITNTFGSTLFRLSDRSLLMGAGPEVAVVGTKSYIAMISVLLLLSYSVAQKEPEGRKLLRAAMYNINEILKLSYIKKIKTLARKLSKNKSIFCIGRGLSYATALETALKLKETSLIHAEGFAGGELKHGAISLIEKGTPCIIISPNDETYPEVISNASEIKARGGYIIGIGPLKNKVFDVWLNTKDCGNATVIPQTVISQLLAYYLALERGVENPDKPRNLAKSVTVK